MEHRIDPATLDFNAEGTCTAQIQGLTPQVFDFDKLDRASLISYQTGDGAWWRGGYAAKTVAEPFPGWLSILVDDVGLVVDAREDIPNGTYDLATQDGVQLTIYLQGTTAGGSIAFIGLTADQGTVKYARNQDNSKMSAEFSGKIAARDGVRVIEISSGKMSLSLKKA